MAFGLDLPRFRGEVRSWDQGTWFDCIVPSSLGQCGAPDITSLDAYRTYSGPNGVIIIEKGSNADVWAGDGPVFNTPCVPGSGLKTPSTVKVLDLNTGVTKAVIETGNGMPGTVGQRRADELCYNPFSEVVLIANDDPLDNFITFISAETYEVLGTIKFDGTDQKGNNILANGIEQCAYNPRDKKFYLNIPNTGPANATSPGPGLVLTSLFRPNATSECLLNPFAIPEDIMMRQRSESSFDTTLAGSGLIDRRDVHVRASRQLDRRLNNDPGPEGTLRPLRAEEGSVDPGSEPNKRPDRRNAKS
jgi:hypothetical protein